MPEHREIISRVLRERDESVSDMTMDVIYTEIPLVQVLTACLTSRGYIQDPTDNSYFIFPDGCTDKLIPAVIDCLENEA